MSLVSWSKVFHPRDAFGHGVYHDRKPTRTKHVQYHYCKAIRCYGICWARCEYSPGKLSLFICTCIVLSKTWWISCVSLWVPLCVFEYRHYTPKPTLLWATRKVKAKLGKLRRRKSTAAHSVWPGLFSMSDAPSVVLWDTPKGPSSSGGTYYFVHRLPEDL